jgi:light-regulated signal transduction histidine kinase (bacteriophytochrome)
MNRIHVTEKETGKPIDQLTHSATQIEAASYRNELMNSTDQPLDFYEKEYIDFIDLAAHELDAPLRKLSLLAGRLTDKFEIVSRDKDMHAYIDRINSCVQNMQSVIENMTILAKIASDKPSYTSCNLADIARQAAEELTTTGSTLNAAIHISTLPLIEGNAAQLSRLFKSLLENALKFTKENVAPEIDIRSSLLSTEEKDHLKLPGEKVYYKVEITDNGIGFKNEYAAKIFRPFVRLHGKSKFSGNGMGLAICKKIVENHHGFIYASSNEKEGALFVLLLPQIL